STTSAPTAAGPSPSSATPSTSRRSSTRLCKQQSQREVRKPVFETTKVDLKKILEQIDQGALQLPDFQRDYVWQDEDVRSLIASIAKGFPVGALLTLESGGSVQFKPRLLEGVKAKEVPASEL